MPPRWHPLLVLVCGLLVLGRSMPVGREPQGKNLGTRFQRVRHDSSMYRFQRGMDPAPAWHASETPSGCVCSDWKTCDSNKLYRDQKGRDRKWCYTEKMCGGAWMWDYCEPYVEEKTAKLFADVWHDGGDWKSDALELYRHLDWVANQSKVSRPMAFYGTLLGQMRHGGLIPWDDDLDCVMDEADFMKIKDQLTKDSRFEVNKAHSGKFYKLFYKQKGDKYKKIPWASGGTQDRWSWPFLDIFLAKSSSQKKVVVPQEGEKDEEYAYADVYPVEPCLFEDLWTTCPKEKKKLLDGAYKGWDQQCYSGSFNHRDETKRTEKTNLPCKDLPASIARLASQAVSRAQSQAHAAAGAAVRAAAAALASGSLGEKI